MDQLIGSQNSEGTGALGFGGQTQSAGVRRHDLDALRAIAMLLGICLHAMAAYSGMLWVVIDNHQCAWFVSALGFIHGFRMQLFFLVSGFFTALIATRYGNWGMLRNRAARILLPFLISIFTLLPIIKVESYLALTDTASHPQDPLFHSIAIGDITTIQEMLDKGGPEVLEQKDSRLRMTPLICAVLSESEQLARYFLDRGADPMAVSRSGENSLTYACLLGRLDLLKLLIAKGGDPIRKTAWGSSPWIAAHRNFSESNSIIWLARGKGLESKTGQSQDRENIIDYLDQIYKNNGISPDSTLASTPREEPAENRNLPGWMRGYFTWLASGAMEVDMGGARIDLLQESLFDHLWFLWFLWWLCLVYACFCAFFPLGTFGKKMSNCGIISGLVVAAALSCLFQAFMNHDYHPRTLNYFIGPDLSVGFIPKPHVFLYYSVFFFFGIWYFRVEDTGCRLGQYWPFTLALAVFVLFPLLHLKPGNMLTNIILQTLFTWLMVVGSIGLAHRVFRGESKWFRYLADSSYWLYLIHILLVLGMQWILYYWPLPGLVKFLLVLIVAIPVMLVSYELFVRHTIIGRILNGKNPKKI